MKPKLFDELFFVESDVMQTFLADIYPAGQETTH